MSSVPTNSNPIEEPDELQAEYNLDYAKARTNRFAAACRARGRLVMLDPDIANVFTTAESVNSVLRALITTMPTTASK
jgi:hypothetical protein